MKKMLRRILSFVMLVCIAFMGVFTMPMVSAKAAGTDTLNLASTGVSDTSYKDWSGVTGVSGAVYAGQSAGGNDSIQLRSKNSNSGIVTTTSGGIAKKITVVWNINTTSGRTLDVYGKNAAYTAASELYSSSTQGTKLGSIVYGTSTELEISGDYEYIGLRSNNGAMYLTSISITWGSASDPSVSISGYNYTMVNSDPLQLTATLNNVSGEVAWKSSNTDVATVINKDDVTGTVTGLSVGTATITASVGTEAEATKEIKVYPSNTDPISIAEAIDICEFTDTTETPYNYSTTGVIASIDDVYSSEYNNITVTITDGTDRIKAFRMAEGSDLQVGDEIKVTGTLVNFEGNTPEFIQGCTYEKKVDNNWEAIKAQLDAVEAYMKLGYKYTQTTTEEEISATTEVTFNLGTDGEAGHSDTTASKDTYSETAEGYTLELTSGEKMYPGSKDALGNGCIKLGTGSATAKFSFTVPEEVTKVFIEVAGYKANKAKVTVNTISYDIDTCSNDGAYTKIEVDTSSTKIVTFETQSTPDERAMLNTITWVVASGAEEGATEEVVTFSNSEFRILCGVNASLLEIENLEVGIQVTAGDKTVNYTTTAESWTVDGDKAYIIINLGDIVNDKAKLETTFTVKAYVIYEDIVRTSKNAAEYSVIGMLNKYTADGVESVAPLVEYLTDKGLM